MVLMAPWSSPATGVNSESGALNQSRTFREHGENSALVPAIPCHRFCRGSGRRSHQTCRPRRDLRRGTAGIDGSKRCLTPEADAERACPSLAAPIGRAGLSGVVGPAASARSKGFWRRGSPIGIGSPGSNQFQLVHKFQSVAGRSCLASSR